MSAIAWNGENLSRQMESYGLQIGQDNGTADNGFAVDSNQPEPPHATRNEAERTISVQFCDESSCICTRQSFVSAVTDYAGRLDPNFHSDAQWLGVVEKAAERLWDGTPEAYGRAEAFFTQTYISLTRPDWLAATDN